MAGTSPDEESDVAVELDSPTFWGSQEVKIEKEIKQKMNGFTKDFIGDWKKQKKVNHQRDGKFITLLENLNCLVVRVLKLYAPSKTRISTWKNTYFYVVFKSGVFTVKTS